MATVLIAEDDPHIRGVLAVWIRRLGHTVLEAADGAAAAAVLAGAEVDLLITDYVMPGMSGPELVRCWRARGQRRPVIMLSASCRREELERVMDELGIAVVRKPFSPSQLMEQVGELLRAGRPVEQAAGTAAGRNAGR